MFTPCDCGYCMAEQCDCYYESDEELDALEGQFRIFDGDPTVLNELVFSFRSFICGILTIVWKSSTDLIYKVETVVPDWELQNAIDSMLRYRVKFKDLVPCLRGYKLFIYQK